MRFSLGLTPYSRFPDLQSLQQTARLAESLGFDGVTISDHALMSAPHSKNLGAVWYDPLVLGTAIALCTTKLRIIFNTLVLPYHHPIRLAKAISTLDVFSGGRVTVGVGVGWMREEFDALGVSYRERGAFTEKSIGIMKALWTGKPLGPASNEMIFEPRPLQVPHPPIWIGGGVRRTLERAAEFGDGWHPLGKSLATLEKEAGELRLLLKGRGRPEHSLTLSYTLYDAEDAARIGNHARAIGGEEATVLERDPQAAMNLLSRLSAIGFSHIVMRLRSNSVVELHDAMIRFAAEIMIPMSPKRS